MIKHLVFWRVRDDEDKQKNMEKMRELLTSLVGVVPGLVSAEVGFNYNPKGFDIALYSVFESKEALDGYQVHQLSVVSEGIFRCLETEKVADKDKETVKKNLEAYFDWLAKSRKESAAFFANLYVNDTYPNAVGFIARECQVLTMSLIIYVKGIKY